MKGEDGRPAIHRECRLQKSSVNDVIGHEKKKLEKPTPGKLNYEWFEGVFRKATLDL